MHFTYSLFLRKKGGRVLTAAVKDIILERENTFRLDIDITVMRALIWSRHAPFISVSFMDGKIDQFLVSLSLSLSLFVRM